MSKRKISTDIPEGEIPVPSRLAADVVKAAMELSLALERARAGGVQMEIEVETIPISGRPPLRQVMAYVISFGDGSPPK